jgi:hypothetical protein
MVLLIGIELVYFKIADSLHHRQTQTDPHISITLRGGGITI